jgi:hypothetical protein
MRSAALIAAAALAGCASAPQAPAVKSTLALTLKNPDFEAASHPLRACPLGWDCSMHSDPNSFRFFHDEAKPLGGKRSLCFEPVAKEPWALASQVVSDLAKLRGARVRFSVAVRLENVTGDGAGPFAVAQGPGGSVIAHDKRLIQGSQGWQRLAVEIGVPQNAGLIEVGVAFEGRGRVCLDDAVLEVLQ